MPGAATGSSSSRQENRCEDICRRSRARARAWCAPACAAAKGKAVRASGAFRSARRPVQEAKRTGKECSAPLACRPARVSTPALPCSFLLFPPPLGSPGCRSMCFRICRILRQVIVVAALHLCAGLTSTSHAGPVAAVGQVSCVCVCVCETICVCMYYTYILRPN